MKYTNPEIELSIKKLIKASLWCWLSIAFCIFIFWYVGDITDIHYITLPFVVFYVLANYAGVLDFIARRKPDKESSLSSLIMSCILLVFVSLSSLLLDSDKVYIVEDVTYKGNVTHIIHNVGCNSYNDEHIFGILKFRHSKTKYMKLKHTEYCSVCIEKSDSQLMDAISKNNILQKYYYKQYSIGLYDSIEDFQRENAKDKTSILNKYDLKWRSN